MTIDPNKLNEARWAACNTRFEEEGVPSMEKMTEVADKVVCAYLGINYEDYAESS